MPAARSSCATFKYFSSSFSSRLQTSTSETISYFTSSNSSKASSSLSAPSEPKVDAVISDFHVEKRLDQFRQLPRSLDLIELALNVSAVLQTNFQKLK